MIFNRAKKVKNKFYSDLREFTINFSVLTCTANIVSGLLASALETKALSSTQLRTKHKKNMREYKLSFWTRKHGEKCNAAIYRYPKT